MRWSSTRKGESVCVHEEGTVSMRTLMILSAALFLMVGTDRSEARDCTSAANTPELTACALAEYERTEVELNETWRAVNGRLDDPDLKRQLLDAQRAWIAFRDIDCDAEPLYFFAGSHGPLSRYYCRTKAARQRIVTLENRYR